MGYIFGIIDFEISLYCSREVLGQSYEIVIGGQKGLLELPFLPHWGEKEKDPLHMHLRPPLRAEKWKRGVQPIYWGAPNSYPSGLSLVEKALFVFECQDPLPNIEVGNAIYKASPSWLELFETYVELISKQNITIDRTIKRCTDRLDLFSFSDEGKNLRVYHHSEPIVICLSDKDTSIKNEQLKKICELCSIGKRPLIEYRIMLEAYRAYAREDYRKSILESATAVELCLTNRIKNEFEVIGLSFGEKLLKKFRMLGGRFELIRLLEIELPEIDYQKLLIDPRNEVVHKAHFPDGSIASKVIEVSEGLLALFSPELAEE